MGKIGVLVADDEHRNFELLHDFITSLGYRVDPADDGQEAVEMAVSGQYALLVLDVNMPLLDGVQVVMAIRSSDATQALPVLVLTADPGCEEQVLAAGADAFMTKPVDLVGLAHAVLRLTSARAAPTLACRRGMPVS